MSILHELSLAEDILQVVVENAKPFDGRPVTRVKVRVGELAMVVPDSLVFAFGVISRGTQAEGAVLEIVEELLAIRCRVCGAVSNELVAVCPECESSDLDRSGGHDVVITSMEIEDAEERA